MRSTDSPCYGNGNGCPDRKVGCHSGCERHHKYQEKLAEEHKAKQDIKKVEDNYCGYYKDKLKVLVRAKGERKRK